MVQALETYANILLEKLSTGIAMELAHNHNRIPTFIAVDKIILDNNAAAVVGTVRLGLATHLPEIHDSILSASCVGRCCCHPGIGHADDMAGQELVEVGKLGKGSIGLGLSVCQQHLSCRNQQDVVACRIALCRQWAAEERGEEGVQGLRHRVVGRVVCPGVVELLAWPMAVARSVATATVWAFSRKGTMDVCIASADAVVSSTLARPTAGGAGRRSWHPACVVAPASK